MFYGVPAHYMHAHAYIAQCRILVEDYRKNCLRRTHTQKLIQHMQHMHKNSYNTYTTCANLIQNIQQMHKNTHGVICFPTSHMLL